MAHITFSIPNPVYKEMKKHPEIKWSEVARQAIVQRTSFLKGSTHTQDFLKLLSPQTQHDIKTVSKQEWMKFSEGVLKAGWKQKKYLTPV